MPFAHFLCKIVILVAFTLVSVKIYVIFNVLHMGALSNVFFSQIFLIYFVCCIFPAILYGFAFNHAVLHVSCILLASKVYANMLQVLQISKFVGISQS